MMLSLQLLQNCQILINTMPVGGHNVRKILIGIAAIIALLGVVVVVKTLTFSSKQRRVAPVEPPKVDADALASRLAKAVRFRTISHQNPADNDPAELLAFHRWLEKTYPAVHRVLKREAVNEYSLLYTWKGQNPSLEPVIFLAHMDVAPVDAGTESDWARPPYDGTISDGFIWGRGTLDMKGILVGIMEAIEHRVAEGHQPRRTIMLGFGHDEEVGGLNGAVKIVELLKSRGVHLKWIIDEGAAITRGVIPGIDGPVALLGISEKGYVTLELIACGKGGHTSMPPYDTAVTRLARATIKLQKNPFPVSMEGPVSQMLDTLGPELPLTARAVLANRWLFGPLIAPALSRWYRSNADASKGINAMFRTTVATTMLQGSSKENVLPIEARALVNVRVHPRDTVQSVLEHIRELFKDDPNVTVKIHADSPHVSDPSPVSRTDTEGYRTIERTVREVFSEAVVTPYPVIAATDSRHFGQLADGIYRFGPFVLHPEDLKLPHGTNERIGVEGFANVVRFYIRLIDNV